jgi:hypothetical protein
MHGEKMSDVSQKIVIIGTTTDGRKFRPSDWAQRLACAVGSMGPGRRVLYHPKVNVAEIDGVSCVIVDPLLEKEDPPLYHFLINFGTHNNLNIDSISR